VSAYLVRQKESGGGGGREKRARRDEGQKIKGCVRVPIHGLFFGRAHI